MNIRETAINNVIESHALGEIVHRFYSDGLTGEDLAKELHEILEDEISYLQSPEYLRKERDADYADLLRDVEKNATALARAV